jgi:protein TIF31
MEQYGCQRVALLRSICLKCGVQMQLKEYSLENKSRPCFTEDDIVNVFPIVKHISPRATDAFHFFSSGQNFPSLSILIDLCHEKILYILIRYSFVEII